MAVVSSGFMGTISGSAVANTVTTGTFTIPLMKRIGFEPPVAFASYAGAAIAKADPMKTGWVAWTFALSGFLLPYMFIYNPPLLFEGPWHEILLASITGGIGIICLGAGVIGYLARATTAAERVLLFAAALLLIKPGWVTDIGGFCCVAVTLFFQLRRPFEKTRMAGAKAEA